MDTKRMYDYGFGTAWKTVHVEKREGYYTSVTDFHEHDFYEINLILSGNVKILLKDSFEMGGENKVVLTSPNTPHYILCQSDTLYSRLYVLFTDEFIANCFPEWKQLAHVFGQSGNILTINKEETIFLQRLIEQIKAEKDLFGQRLLIYYLLLRLNTYAGTTAEKQEMPSYIFDALMYLEKHYHENIDFSLLVKKLCVGRTKLMTEFKLHTGTTLGEYLCKCRLKNAVQYLLQNQTIEFTAEKCGFSDSSSLIRAFKRVYGTTPHRYVKNLF